ncbi:MAG: hypothetical protein D6731_05060 [Planctomycetota bacterium]|nr:MAG: hypothetical protein D6731_05060 [Planctomycetota bacterium]
MLFVDDRRLLSAGAEGLRLWELPEALGRRRKPRRLEPRSVFGTEDTFASLARLTQGVVESLFLAGTAEGSVRALALGEAGGLLGPSVRLAARGSPHRDDVESLAAFPPGARYLAAAACQDRVHLLQLGEGLALRAIAAAQLPSRAATVAVAGAGRWLLAGVASRKVGGGLGDLGNAVVFELTEVDTAHRAWPRLIRRDPLGIGELRSCLERPADLLAGTQEGNLRPLAWTEAPTPQEDPLRPAPPWTVPGERSLGSAVLRAAHSGPVRALVRLHDGRILSLSGLAQGQRAPNRSPVSELRLWSPRGDHLAGGEAPGPTRRDGFGLALSPSGERFAVALEGGDGFCGVEVYGVPPP